MSSLCWLHHCPARSYKCRRRVDRAPGCERVDVLMDTRPSWPPHQSLAYFRCGLPDLQFVSSLCLLALREACLGLINGGDARKASRFCTPAFGARKHLSGWCSRWWAGIIRPTERLSLGRPHHVRAWNGAATWQPYPSGAPRCRSGVRADAASGARYGLFVSPRWAGLAGHGLGRPVAAILASIVHARHAAGKTRRWPRQIEAAGAPEPCFDAVILATPGHASARLLEGIDPQLNELIGRIPYAGSVVASIGYAREQIEHPLNAAGLVVPEIERRDILAVSFSSQKFAGRAPPGHVLLRVLGRARSGPSSWDSTHADRDNRPPRVGQFAGGSRHAAFVPRDPLAARYASISLGPSRAGRRD